MARAIVISGMLAVALSQATPASAALVTTIATGTTGEAAFTLTFTIDTGEGSGEETASFQTRYGGSAYGAVNSPGSASLVIDGITQALFAGTYYAYFQVFDDPEGDTSGLTFALYDHDPGDDTHASNRYLQLSVGATSGALAPTFLSPFDLAIDGVDVTAYSAFSLSENLFAGSYQRTAGMALDVERVWSTVALAPVPVPASWPIFAAGVAMIAAARRHTMPRA